MEEQFAKEGADWDIMFGTLLWSLWCNRNAVILVTLSSGWNRYCNEVDVCSWCKLNTDGAVGLHEVGLSKMNVVGGGLVFQRRLAFAPLLRLSSGVCPRRGRLGLIKLLSRQWQVRLAHVRREGNCVADWLAKHAPLGDFLYHRFMTAPVGILDLLQQGGLE
ncbi:hypothetical protein V6N12_028793 [Hibiscus sabdariffa]|uniref:RNase H type-1 domain-containing protein n=1 Tax=Hibiscus sabdariffa TaxID=183260 RepID=A0ABR2F6W8_9ROSI